MADFECLPACQFPGCGHPALGGDWTAPDVCAGHLALAASSERRRLLSVQRRAAVIEALWADAARYAGGRYLKLVDARQRVSECTGTATERFMLSIYANVYPSRGRSPAKGWRAKLWA
jgi:hypothetical protein